MSNFTTTLCLLFPDIFRQRIRVKVKLGYKQLGAIKSTTTRASASPAWICHVNFHTTGQFHVNPDNRPEERRFRLDTVSLRGVFNQQIFGSKRCLRSVEDFTEFEQRTAYFNGDEIHAIKKGMNILDRIQVTHMAQMQKMIDSPPAPKLDPITAHLIKGQATEAELRGEQIFFGPFVQNRPIRCGPKLPRTPSLNMTVTSLVFCCLSLV